MIHLTVISAAVTLSSFPKADFMAFLTGKKTQNLLEPFAEFLLCWSLAQVPAQWHFCATEGMLKQWNRVSGCFPALLWITQEMSACKENKEQESCWSWSCAIERCKRASWLTERKREESKRTDKRLSMEMCCRKMLALVSGRSYDYSMRISNWEEME